MSTGPEQASSQEALIEMTAKSAVLSLLSEVPVYRPDAPIAQYVEARVAHLCGDEYRMPRVFVRENDQGLACSLPGFLVIDTNLLDLLDSEEELDAILAHELVHIDEEHSTQPDEEDLLADIGQRRVQEVEADVKGAMLLDRRGINPRGMVSAFDKLDKYVRDKKLTESATHGKTEGRAVNIDQGFLLYDARSLEHGPLTPLPQIARNTPSELAFDLEAYKDDPILGQAILARRFHNFKGRPSDLEALVARQTEMLSADGSLATEDAKRLARTIAVKYNPVLTRRLFGPQVTLDLVTNFISDTESQAVQARTGLYGKAQLARVSNRFIKSVFASYFEPAEVTEIIERLYDETGNYEFCHAGFSSYSRIHKDDRASAELLADVVAPTGIVAGSYAFRFEEAVERRFVSRIANRRLRVFNELQESGDYVAVLDYVSGFAKTPEDMAIDVDEEGSMSFNITYEAYMWRAPSPDGEEPDGRSRGMGEPGIVWDYVTDLLATIEPTTITAVLEGSELNDKAKRRIAIFLLEADVFSLEANSVSRTHTRGLNFLPLCLLSGREGMALDLINGSLEEVVSATIGLIEVREIKRTQKEVDRRNNREHWLELEETINDLGSAQDRSIAEALARINWQASSMTEDTLYRETLVAWSQLVQEVLGDERFGARYGEQFDTLAQKSELVRDYQLLAALEQFAAESDAQAFITLMDTHGLPRIRGGGAFSEAAIANTARKYWETGVEQVLGQPDLMENDQALLALMALGMSAENVEVNLHVPAEALRRLVQLHTFDEGLELVFDRFSHLPAFVVRSAVDELMEQKARSLEDFAKLDEYMVAYVNSFVDEQRAGIGLGSIIETYLIDAYKQARARERYVGTKTDEVNGLESVRLIQAMLSTAQSDQAIREYIFKRWWLASRTSTVSFDLEPYFKVEDISVWRHPNKAKQLAYWLQELPPPGSYQPIEEVLSNLYLSNAGARYLAVRSILLGDGGVLEDADGKQGLVSGLMESWLDFEEGSETQRMLQNLLSAFMEGSDSRDIYKFIGPILQELVLRPPQVFADNYDVARGQAKKVIEAMSQPRIGQGGMMRPAIMTRPTDADLDNVTTKIINLMRGQTTPTEPTTAAETTRALLDLFGGQQVYELKTMSPTQLALMAGKKSGSLGVRVLQLAGQYYPIPAEEQDSYNEVYDSMKGQTRIQAYRVLMREAEHSQTVAELLNDIESIDERLGGGSLVTVYGITLRDGTKEILGIRNPNAEYHVVQLATMAQKALDIAIERDPDNTDLHLAQSLIEDAVTWIRDELNDTAFNLKDAVFRDQNDTRTGTGFRKGRSRYDLLVPVAPPTDSLWVRREAYVPGVNLNNLKVVDDRPTNLAERQISRGDYQDAISLLVRDHLHQMNEGAYVHSDVHMGNFRITEDNQQLAVFDRYNLIPVVPELRSTVQGVMRTVATGDVRGAIAVIVGYAQGEQGDVNATVDQVVASIHAGADSAEGMAQTIVELRKAGIKLPIQLSLLLRNIFSLSKVTKNAGFENVLEAFMHTAEEDEVRQALARLMGA